MLYQKAMDYPVSPCRVRDVAIYSLNQCLWHSGRWIYKQERSLQDSEPETYMMAANLWTLGSQDASLDGTGGAIFLKLVAYRNELFLLRSFYAD